MGQEVSSSNSAQSPADIQIPTSLRPIHPFLEDAQRNLCNARKADDPTLIQKRKKIAVACINHAFKLMNILNLEWDAEGRACLDTFRVIRDSLSAELGFPVDPATVLQEYAARPPYPSHEIIVAEADEALALGELQLLEGFRFEAMLNFHTACVYYRVMECMIPAITAHVHQRLQYAAWRTRQCSSLSNNFVREHFDGESCSEVYEVHGANKLGKGSYGSVYLATHRLTGDERAVKVMNVDRVTSYYLRKLHTEISILKCVDHPNIVKLQDVFFGKRSVYLVTDLCRGGELFELLNSGKNQGFVFREDRASRLMRDMLSAVHYLHSRGIVHRDLKLENFLFEAKNSSSPLVLIDFGLSKHFDKEDKLTHRVGSCYYTAPEVLAGNYDYRCDVWSLGVLCYMLLSGSPPFYGKTVEDVYKATSTQDPVFPDKKFRHLSPVCMDFMRRLLVKDPNQRMTTWHALRHPFITGQTAPMPSLSSSHTGMGSNGNPGLSNLMGGSHGTQMMSSSSSTGTTAPVSSSSSWGMGSIGMSMAFSQGQTGTSGQSTTQPPHPPSLQQPLILQGGGQGPRGEPIISLESASKILDSILVYMSADPLTRLTFEMVAHSLCADHVQQLRIEFQAMDRNHQGILSLNEFLEALHIAQPYGNYGSIDLVTAFNAMAVERSRGGPRGLSAGPDYGQGATDSGLTYHEFMAAAMINRIELTEERVALAFNCMDIERTGYLSTDGIRLALGDDLPQSTIETMLTAAFEGAQSRGELPQQLTQQSGSGPPPMVLRLPEFISNFRVAYLQNAPTSPPSVIRGGREGPSHHHQQQQQQTHHQQRGQQSDGSMDVDI